MLQEKPEGKLADAWAAALESRGVQTVDVAPGIAETLAVKDASEITHIKKASLVAAKAARMSLTPKIEGPASSPPSAPRLLLSSSTHPPLLRLRPCTDTVRLSGAVVSTTVNISL